MSCIKAAKWFFQTAYTLHSKVPHVSCAGRYVPRYEQEWHGKWRGGLNLSRQSGMMSQTQRPYSTSINTLDYVSALQQVRISYTERDVVRYALEVGVTARTHDSLKFFFGLSDEFCVLPSFLVLPTLDAVSKAFLTVHFNVEPYMIHHEELYIKLLKPLGRNASLVTKGQVTDVTDRGGAGVVVTINVDIFDEERQRVANTRSTIFVKSGCGGNRDSDMPVQPADPPPGEKPDSSIIESIDIDEAALYRLSGENRINPSFAALGGCSERYLDELFLFGVSARHVLRQYCNNDVTRVDAFKVPLGRSISKYSNPLYTGERIRTDMWRRNNRIYFEAKGNEIDSVCLTGAYVDIHDGDDGEATTTTSTTTLSMVDDTNVWSLVEREERRFLLICVNDYEKISVELSKRGLLMESEEELQEVLQQEEEPQNKPLKLIKSFKLLIFFGVQIDRPSKSFGLAEDQNLECHSSFTEDEFVKVAEVAERNVEILLKYNRKLQDVKKLIKNLQMSRRFGLAKYYITDKLV